jgi:hypothetical protein
LTFFIVVENVVNSVLGSENTGSGQTSWPPLLKGAIWKQYLKETQVIVCVVLLLRCQAIVCFFSNNPAP